MDISVSYEGKTAVVRLGLTSTDAAIKHAVASGMGVPLDRKFGLIGGDGNVVTASIGSLADGGAYQVRLVPLPCPPVASVEEPVGMANGGGGGGGGTPGLTLPLGAHGVAGEKTFSRSPLMVVVGRGRRCGWAIARECVLAAIKVRPVFSISSFFTL
jgi:hypothetical protein